MVLSSKATGALGLGWRKQQLGFLAAQEEGNHQINDIRDF